MTNDQMTLGARVRLARRVGGVYPGAMYCIDPGPVGTVILLDEDQDADAFCGVRFDKRIEHLDDWDNVLFVSADETGDASAVDFVTA